MKDESINPNQPQEDPETEAVDQLEYGAQWLLDNLTEETKDQGAA